MTPKTLRSVIRELAAARGRGSRGTIDWEQVRPLVSTVWERMQNDWPRLRSWFEAGLTEAEYVRYVALARRLPNRLDSDERRELLNLTMRGLRLGERSADDVEGTLAPDHELDTPRADPSRGSPGTAEGEGARGR